MCCWGCWLYIYHVPYRRDDPAASYWSECADKRFQPHLFSNRHTKVLQVTYWDVWISCRGWMGSKHRKTWETLSSAFYSLTTFIFEFLLFFPYLFSFQNLKKRISRLIRCWLSLWRSNNRERSSVRLQTSDINQPDQTMSLLMRVISKTVFALFNFIYPQIWLQVVRYSPCNNHLCQQLLLKLKLKLKLRVFNIWVAFLTSLAWDGGEALAHWALVTNFGRVPKGGRVWTTEEVTHHTCRFCEGRRSPLVQPCLLEEQSGHTSKDRRVQPVVR